MYGYLFIPSGFIGFKIISIVVHRCLILHLN